jgi:hypothetical protein
VDSHSWNELLAEFRALGGVAENIRLGEGRFGRGIFPLDPARPVAIHIPENLLIPAKDMVFADGKLRVGPASSANDREKAWLDRYQEELGWGGGGADDAMRMLDMVAQLPVELRHQLLTKYLCGPWFMEPSDELIRDRFFNSRTLTYGGVPVVIPLVELANHGQDTRYDVAKGVGLSGTYQDEILVQYADLDAFDFFLSWGFAVLRPLAFSVPMGGNIQSTPLRILPGYGGHATSPRDWIPKFEKSANGVTLDFLMLGNERYPRLCKGIFYRLMREAGYSGYEECFDLVHHTNRLHFLEVVTTLDDIALPIARIVRQVAHYQLRALSFCYGVREIA